MSDQHVRNSNEVPINSLVSSFSTVWAEHKPLIYKKCNRWLNGNIADVEDALSETAMKAFANLQKKQHQIQNIQSWLCKLAFNVCIDLYRSNKRQSLLVEQVSSLPDTFHFASNCSEDLEDFAIRHDNFEQVMLCIASLPEELKVVLMYRFIEGLDYAEIAHRLDIAQPTVRKRVQMGRTKLKQLTVV